MGRKFLLRDHGFQDGPEKDPHRVDDLLETRKRFGQLSVPHERGPLGQLCRIGREVTGEADRIDDDRRLAPSKGAQDRFRNNAPFQLLSPREQTEDLSVLLQAHIYVARAPCATLQICESETARQRSLFEMPRKLPKQAAGRQPDAIEA